MLLGFFQLQAQFVDYFHLDTLAEHWQGDRDFFVVEDYMLRSAGPEASSTLHLSTSIPSVFDRHSSFEWEFRIELDFDPSSSNYVRYYLWSDTVDLQSSSNALYLQIGQSSADDSDSAMLFLLQDGVEQLLHVSEASCIQGNEDNMMDFRFLRDSLGMLRFWMNCDESSWSYQGSVLWTQELAGFTGLLCRYVTASRSDAYAMDYVILQPPWPDLRTPVISELEAVDDQTIRIVFNEAMDVVSCIDPNNYQLEELLPIWVMQDAERSNSFQLAFEEEFPKREAIELRVSALIDTSGNQLEDTSIVFIYDPLESGRILITEILPDESEDEERFPLEFIELYNPFEQSINLEGLRIFDISGESDGFTEYYLDGFTYTVLIDESDYEPKKSTGVFDGINVLPVKSLPTINNANEEIRLVSPDGIEIDSVAYDSGLIGHDLEEGQSLERIDLSRTWLGSCNWTGNESFTGSSAGMPNSTQVYDWGETPEFQQSFRSCLKYIDEDQLALHFFDRLDPQTEFENFIHVDGGDVSEIIYQDESIISLNFAEEIEDASLSIKVDPFLQCNSWFGGDEMLWEFPHKAEPGQLLINEVLFDGNDESSDFVEIINTSDSCLSLDNVYLEEFDEEGIVQEEFELSENLQYRDYVLPGEVMAFSQNPEKDRWRGGNPLQFVEHEEMFNLPDSEQERILRLVRRDLYGERVLDSIKYQESWHHEFARETENVSLERISKAAHCRFTPQDKCWTSASWVANGATPGLPNSQAISEVLAANDEQSLKLRYQIISPNGDAFQDDLLIDYHFDEPANVLDVMLYTMQAKAIAYPANFELLGASGHIRLAPTDSNGNILSEGTYLLVSRAFRNGSRIAKIQSLFYVRYQ
jgi:hypothetical protein